MLLLKTPFNGEKVSLQTPEQKSFVCEEEARAKSDGTPVAFRWDGLKKLGIDRTLPLPVSFSWELTREPKDTEIYCLLLISESRDMKSPWLYITKECFFDVYNLKVGTEYFWCVQINGKRSEVFSFKTLLTLPRCLKIDAVPNVRDMGGYAVTGGRIRQGLLYRGSEFESHTVLTPSGAEEISRLKIKTEVDMRGESIGVVEATTAECLGVKRIFIPSVPYTEIFDEKQRAALGKLYRAFASPKNYPLYFHCWGGADRTGTVAFIIGAFLGMSYDDLIYDYEFTSLSVWGPRSRNYAEFKRFVSRFMSLSGETLSEKAATFLKDRAGLTDKQLLAIYDTLVEKNDV